MPPRTSPRRTHVPSSMPGVSTRSRLTCEFVAASRDAMRGVPMNTPSTGMA